MTEGDFVIPEEILTFFVVSRKTEAFRKALDKNIYFDFVLLFYFCTAQIAKWSNFSFQFPTILAPKV